MRKTYVLGILATLAVVIIWFTLRDSEIESPEALAPTGSGGVEPQSIAKESLASPNTPVQERTVGLSEPRVDEPLVERDAGKLAEVAASELKWIEGRLLLPNDAVWDETAAALSVEAPERKRASRALFRMISREEEQPTREADVLYRGSFAKDGSFRVACSSDAEWGYLDIDALHLFLPEPQAVKLEGEITYVDLAPLLGGSIKGRWVAEPLATSVEREFSDGQVFLTVLSSSNLPAFLNPNGSDGPAVFRRTRVTADGQFELRGLDPTVDWALVSQPLRLASVVTSVPTLTPGEQMELEVELLRGSRLSGRVVDASGEPLFGARLSVSSMDEELEFSRRQLVSRESLSRGDGSFDVYGVAVGEVRLHAELEGYRRSVRKKFDLEPGSVETGILLKLRRGKALRGSISWQNGQPAVGATVEVGRDATGRGDGISQSWRTRYGSVQADDNGAFEILGLKRRASSLWAWSSRKDAGRWIEGMVRLDGVEPSEEEEHALFLEEQPLLTGIVRDGQGQPVTNFKLLIRPDEGAGSMMNFYATQGMEVERDVSSPDGSFLLERLDVGDFSVVVEADGFATSTPLGFQLPIDRDTPPLLIELGHFSGLSGIVVAPDGSTTAGMDVMVMRGELRSVDAVLAEVRAPVTTKTNGNGEFAFSQLQPGRVELMAKGSLWVDSASVELELAPGETRSGVTVALRVGATLTGELLDSEEQPVVDRTIQVSHANPDRREMFRGMSQESTSTDANGWFEINNLVPGAATITVRAPRRDPEDLESVGWSAVAMASFKRDVELFENETTHVVLGGKIENLGDPVPARGRVTRGGNAVSAQVTFAFMDERIGSKNISASTDDEGNFETELPYPGDYRITVNPENFKNARFFRRVRQVESEVFEFSLPAGRISGTIFDTDGELADQIPVSLRRVGLTGSVENQFGSSFFNPQQTGEDGVYEFDNLGPGTYVIGAGSSFMTLFMGGAIGYGRTLTDPLELAKDEDLMNVDLRLGVSCALKGEVFDGEGNPVNGASIFVYDAVGTPIDVLSTTTSNASGRFLYEGLSPGIYTAMARTGEQVSLHSKPVEVDEDLEASTELTLRPGTMLKVSLLDEFGVAIPSSIRVTDDNGRELNGLERFGSLFGGFREDSGESATHKVGPVPAGGYRISARAEGYEPATRDILVRDGERELQVAVSLGE